MKKLIPANGTASGARCKTKRISTKREASMKARAFFHLRQAARLMLAATRTRWVGGAGQTWRRRRLGR